MPDPKKPWQGLLSATIAVLFFGLAGVLGKLSTLPSPIIVFGRVFFTGLVLLPLCLLQCLPIQPRRSRDGFFLAGQDTNEPVLPLLDRSVLTPG